MDLQNDLSGQFPSISREQWLTRMERDLKGKPVSDLRWQLEEDIFVEPFYVGDDLDPLPPPFRGNRQENRWEIGELVETENIADANARLCEGLEGGVEAPLIILRRELSDEEMRRLFQGVHLDLISTHFTQVHPDKQPPQLLQQFRRLAQSRGYDPAILAGSIDYDPILDWAKPPYDQLAETILFCRDEMPRFCPLQINGLRFHSGPENTSQELAFIIAKGSEFLAQLQARNIGAETTNRYLQFTVAICSSYFVEIAKIRALKLLWANVLKGYGVQDPSLPPVVAHLARETQTEDIHLNMIRAGTQAMSAIIGGAARLYVRPANFALNEPTTPFSRRIARNVQHILRLESHLDRVIDPAAGSYYVEKLTGLLAGRAWEQFRQFEAGGAFS